MHHSDHRGHSIPPLDADQIVWTRQETRCAPLALGMLFLLLFLCCFIAVLPNL